MKQNFKSDDFIFRPTTLSAALQEAGMAKISLVREEKCHGLLRARQDKENALPSIRVHLKAA